MKTYILLLGTASAAVLMGVPWTASAQSSNAEIELQDDVVIVTGTRLQNQQSVDQKRNADNIVDSITADDVGALPDFSIAEAVSRITGVSFEGRNGDAEFVVVRGIRSDFNFLEIDGGVVPSTRRNGRATQLSIIPSYVIKTTDVTKSFSADMDANTIGGTISVQTRSAFDQDDTYFAARGALGYFDQNEGPEDLDLSSRGDFAFAKSFGPNDEFGIVLSGSYLKQDYNTWLPGVSFSEYEFFDPNVDTGGRQTRLENAASGFFLVPHGVQNYQYNNEIERIGGFGKLEWAPSDAFYLSLSAYQFEEDDTEQRWDNLLFRNRRGNRPANITEFTGTVEQGRLYRQYFLQGDTNTLRSVNFNGSWSPDERHQLDFLITASDGERENPFYQIRFDSTTANESSFGFNYDARGEYPRVALTNPDAYSDHALLRPLFYRPRFDINNQEAFQAKLDYAYNMNKNGFGFETGLSFRSDERFQDQLFDNDFRPDSDRTRAFTFDNAVLDFTNSFEPQLIVDQPEFFIDQTAFLTFFNATQAEWNDRKTPDNEALSSEFRVSEDIAAIYAQIQHRSDNWLLRAGIRYEDTQLDSDGFRQIRDDDDTNELFPRVDAASSYGEWLPSASAIWTPSDVWKLRAAYSRTLGRAEYDDLSVLGDTTFDDAEQSVSIRSGNPGLDPRVSDNFDIIVEHYFDKIDGAVALGVFHKEIENEIYTRTEQSETTIGGQLYTVSERRPVNANSATITGIEAGVTVNSLDFLSDTLADIGFTANYAYIDSEFSIELSEDGDQREVYGLPRQPKNILNATAFWAPGDFEFKAAYAYSDENLISTSASSPTFDEFIGPRKRLDLRARYKFGQRVIPGHITLFGEARNILGDGVDRDLSYLDRTKWTRDFGASFWVGAIYKY